MKVPNLPGEYFFKALYRQKGSYGFALTGTWFKTYEDAEKYFGGKADFFWPCEMVENEEIYVPSKEEMNPPDAL